MRGSGIDNEPNAEDAATTIAQAEQWLDESIERNLDRGAQKHEILIAKNRFAGSKRRNGARRH
jgi:hypothetical protein